MPKFKTLEKFNKDIFLVAVTVLITVMVVTGVRKLLTDKPRLNLSYPATQPLPSEFKQLTCEEVSTTYQRAWQAGSDIVHDSSARVQMSLTEQKLQDWGGSYKDANGNFIDNSQLRKSRIYMNFEGTQVKFSGDSLWQLEKHPFKISVNDPNHVTGLMQASLIEPRTDVMGSFMLDKHTSLLMLSDTDASGGPKGSFGARTRLFTCQKTQ